MMLGSMRKYTYYRPEDDSARRGWEADNYPFGTAQVVLGQQHSIET
jgi:hypothetical protein